MENKEEKIEFADLDFGMITSIPLFEYIDCLFTDPVKWKKITDNVKRSHFFMLNRRIAIAFPIIANSVNINGIDVVDVSELYHAKLCSGRKPKFLYTKAGTDEPEIQIKLDVSKFHRGIISALFTLDRKTFDSLVRRKPEWILEMIEIIDRSHRSRLSVLESKNY